MPVMMSTHMIKTHSLIMTIAMKTGDFYKKKKKMKDEGQIINLG